MKKAQIISTIILLLSMLFCLTSCMKGITSPSIPRVERPAIYVSIEEDGEPKRITIFCETGGASIYYTLDGSEPTNKSTKYTEPFEVHKDLTIKAKAFKKDMKASDTEYRVLYFQAAAVIIDPPAGMYASPLTVTMECPTEGVQIYYATDGNWPTPESNRYDGPIVLNSNTIIRAMAYRVDWSIGKYSDQRYGVVNTNFETVLIPAGSFNMGRTKGDGWTHELPVHNVSLNSFYIDKYPITQGEYQLIMGTDPDFDYMADAKKPVNDVSWNHAIKYCNLRSINEGYTPVYSLFGSTNPADWGDVPELGDVSWDSVVCDWNANGYRLPTEAEWEYAARGAQNYPDYLYSGSDALQNVGWYFNNSENLLQDVGTLSPNSLDIYDMSGNIREWCWDWFDEAYYANSPSDNPKGPDSGEYRVLRGGYWNERKIHCRVSARSYHPYPFVTGFGNGFRVCRTAP
ncbi:MAG: SUMF1/EgtB/PvdO family nonheme iron enzyme [Candidatus Cloacimonadaceae bacterium]